MSDSEHGDGLVVEAGAERLALHVDRSDLVERLEAARSGMRRHGLWAVLGFTPLALIPILGLLLEGSFGLVALLTVLVVAVELARYHASKDEVRRLAKALEHLDAAEEVGDLSTEDRTARRPPAR